MAVMLVALNSFKKRGLDEEACKFLITVNDGDDFNVISIAGSPSHNNLTGFGFNDRLQSFRLCDLDEERFDAEDCPASLGSSCRRSMHSSRPERWFWEFFFRLFNTTMCNVSIFSTKEHK